MSVNTGTYQGSSSAISTPAPEAGRQQRFYRPELDTLRTLAFLMVFGTHTLGVYASLSTWFVTAGLMGAFGVPLFFVLSAFLITELLLRERQRTGKVSVRSFYIRRALRIWPLYFSFIAVGIVWHIFHHSRLPGSLIAAYLTFWANWWYVIHGFPLTFLSPLWSISIEEQFYLLWPLTVLLFGRRGLIVVACLGWLLFLPVLFHLGPETFLTTWANSLVQAQFFAVGALLAIGLHGVAWKLSNGLRITMLLGGLLALASAAWFLQHHPVGFSTFAPVYALMQLGCALLLVGIYQTQMKLFQWAPVVWMGKISYGLYVLHVLVLESALKITTYFLHGRSAAPYHFLTMDVAALLATIALASASYRWLERPFLTLKDRFTIVRSRAA